MDDKIMVIDDCDKAILGLGFRCGQQECVVYDYDALVQCFIEQGMDEEAAEEWISYNVEGAWVGDGTPMVLHRMNREEIDEWADQ